MEYLWFQKLALYVLGHRTIKNSKYMYLNIFAMVLIDLEVDILKP
jgi:hypothetical protein